MSDPALDALRRQIDTIDDAIHDLIMRRTEIVERVGALKRTEGGPFFRPAREAEIVRRLMARHKGAFPKPVVMRLWRELINGTMHLEGPFAAAVFAPEGDHRCWDLARDHVGSFVPLQGFRTQGQVIRAVSDGQAQVGVLPFPRDQEPDPWWAALMSDAPSTPRVVAMLPFAARGDEEWALLVALQPAQETGSDRTFLGLETAAISRSRLGDVLADGGLSARRVVSGGDTETRLHLVEVEGFIDVGSEDLARLRQGARPIRQLQVLGAYAIPFAPADLA